MGGSFTSAPGGKGANQAVAAARAGGDVTFIACVGDDMFGQEAKEGFEKDGLNIEHIKVDKTEPSGVALIFVAKSGENSIAVAGGANNRLSPDDIEKSRGIIASAGMLVMQLETPLETIEAAARIAFENSVRVILNPAPARPLSKSVLQAIDVLTPNESEAALLTGVEIHNDADAGKAAHTLLEMGVNTVLITMGSRGSYIATKRFEEKISSFKVKAVDTTAAGDVFNGALAVALTESKPVKEAARFASAAAALAVTKMGSALRTFQVRNRYTSSITMRKSMVLLLKAMKIGPY